MTSSFAPSTPLRSIHTQSFNAVLAQMELTLVVSTYQAGKLIFMRADGQAVNTHFRVFDTPMGVAADREKIAVGTTYAIEEFHNVPAVAAKISPPDRHDGCYLPRRKTITGDIDIHEMAWVDQELWFINTRFSCLCTLDARYSFVPRWRPPFITGYDLTDRCHLNGLGIRDHRPYYVTALGETDRPNGWRTNKANGGILMDITTNEVIVRGLSMPHSPRWYRDRLWVLESGRGTLAQVDLVTGTLTTVVELPGFTRGIDFWGDLAFIGLSQIRETAVFSGIPLTQTLTERICGVWMVNIVSGEVVAFLKFEDAVQEIFAVSVLPGLRFPELVEHDDEILLSSSYVLPDAAMAEVASSTPNQPSADRYFEQGCAYYEAGEREAAVAALQQCLTVQPDYLPARYNLGVILGELARYKTAISYLHQVIAADARHADAHKSLGHLYSQQNQVKQARWHYEQAVRIRPQDAQAHYNLGMTCLTAGDFETGWAECEWRWQTAEFTPFNCPQPRWQGQPLPQQTLLIHTEQGAGDAIQFVRYVSWAAAHCQRVILVCPAPLLPLLEKLPGVDQCQTSGEIALNAFDAYVPLMSLPYLARTTVETIPAQVPYLQADASRCPLPSQKKTRRVGIVWAGSPTHGNDRQRSTQLPDWLPVLRVPGIEFFSLQKGPQVQALADLPQDINVQNLDAVIHDYADTVSVVAQLDLVIGVDTSVIHVAGALGLPCWTLLCYSPDWRWFTPRTDSPWYPTMRLFWQTQPGDWTGVFEQVAIALGHTS